MCTVVCDGSCRARSSSTGVAAVTRLTWWLARRVIGPLLLAIAVISWRWFTGAPMRPTWTGQRRVTRPVRAVAQTLATLIAVAAAFRPLLTAAVVSGVGLALVATAVITRQRARVRALPIRVAATIPTSEPARQITAGSPWAPEHWTRTPDTEHTR